jgi:hypothetical protein
MKKNYSAEAINQINSLNNFLYLRDTVINYNISLFIFEYTGRKNYKSILGQEKIGFDWSEMVMSCFFMNSDCNTTYEEVFSPKYGKCYTLKDSGQICNLKLLLNFLFYIIFKIIRNNFF